MSGLVVVGRRGRCGRRRGRGVWRRRRRGCRGRGRRRGAAVVVGRRGAGVGRGAGSAGLGARRRCGRWLWCWLGSGSLARQRLRVRPLRARRPLPGLAPPFHRPGSLGGRSDPGSRRLLPDAAKVGFIAKRGCARGCAAGELKIWPFSATACAVVSTERSRGRSRPRLGHQQR